MNRKNKLKIYDKKSKHGKKHKNKDVDLNDLGKIFDMGEESDPIERTKPGISGKLKPDEGYHIFDFLINEKERLDKLNIFFSEKLKNVQRNPQTEKLIHNQQSILSDLKERVISKSIHPDSRINRRLEYIWDSAFGNS